MAQTPMTGATPVPATAPLRSGPDPVRGAASVLAPGGTLRAAINFGNPVLAQRAPDGTPGGVSVLLARTLAERLGIPLTIIPFESAGAVTDALPRDVFDLCFVAADPVRGQGLSFTAPYVLIEGGYAVRPDAPFATVASVDAAGVAVAVARGSAYDLFLTRTLKHATLVRFADGVATAEGFLAGTGDVLAGVKSPLTKLAEARGLRMLPDRFMSIEQTMALPKSRDLAALAALQTFIAEMKASGTVAGALAASGQADAIVAP